VHKHDKQNKPTKFLVIKKDYFYDDELN